MFILVVRCDLGGLGSVVGAYRGTVNMFNRGCGGGNRPPLKGVNLHVTQLSVLLKVTSTTIYYYCTIIKLRCPRYRLLYHLCSIVDPQHYHCSFCSTGWGHIFDFQTKIPSLYIVWNRIYKNSFPSVFSLFTSN